MTSFMKLGNTFAPHPDEGLPGYLLRLACANDITLCEFTAELVGRRADEFACLGTRNEHALGLACLTGLDQKTIELMMHADTGPNMTSFFGEPIAWSAIERGKCRLAPGRMSGDIEPYHRAVWSLRIISCDPTTGEELIDRCACGRLLWWNSLSRLVKCHGCGSDHDDLTSVRGAPEAVETSRFWADLYSPDQQLKVEARSRLPDDLRETPNSALLRIATLLTCQGYSLDAATDFIRGNEIRKWTTVSPRVRQAIERMATRRI